MKTLKEVCANDAQLLRIEQQLNQFVSLLKSRLQWLNSSSRLLLGALVHSHAIIIIDSSLSDANQLTSFLDAVKLFLKEQVSAIVKFNIIRCTGGLTSFADNLLKVLPGVVQEGIQWLDEAHSSSFNAPMTNNLIEAVTRAIACEGNDAVYILTQGRSALRSYSSLFNMLQLSHVPVNISVYECTDPGALDDYKELCRVCNGRLHVYNP
uniref:VWFA domain-containing protein n=1 Tax=Amphimedon queenslandica TaxID=400682 RepID=A0A1X7T005_AMPQE